MPHAKPTSHATSALAYGYDAEESSNRAKAKTYAIQPKAVRCLSSVAADETNEAVATRAAPADEAEKRFSAEPRLATAVNAALESPNDAHALEHSALATTVAKTETSLFPVAEIALFERKIKESHSPKAC